MNHFKQKKNKTYLTCSTSMTHRRFISNLNQKELKMFDLREPVGDRENQDSDTLINDVKVNAQKAGEW